MEKNKKIFSSYKEYFDHYFLAIGGASREIKNGKQLAQSSLEKIQDVLTLSKK